MSYSSSDSSSSRSMSYSSSYSSSSSSSSSSESSSSYSYSSSSESSSSQSLSSSSNSMWSEDVFIYGLQQSTTGGTDLPISGLTVNVAERYADATSYCSWRPTIEASGTTLVAVGAGPVDIGAAWATVAVYDGTTSSGEDWLYPVDFGTCEDTTCDDYGCPSYPGGLESPEARVLVDAHCFDETWVAFTDTSNPEILMWYRPDYEGGWYSFFNSTMGGFGPKFIDAAISPDCGTIYMTDLSTGWIVALDVETQTISAFMGLSYADKVGGIALDCNTNLLYQSVKTSGSYSLLVMETNPLSTVASIPISTLLVQLWMECKPDFVLYGINRQSDVSQPRSSIGVHLSQNYTDLIESCTWETTPSDEITVEYSDSCTWETTPSDEITVEYSDVGWAYAKTSGGYALLAENFDACGTAENVAPGVSGQAMGLVNVPCEKGVWVATNNIGGTMTWFRRGSSGDWESTGFVFIQLEADNVFTDTAMSNDCSTIFLTDAGHKKIYQSMTIAPFGMEEFFSLESWNSVGGLAVNCDTDTIFQSVSDDSGRNYLLEIHYNKTNDSNRGTIFTAHVSERLLYKFILIFPVFISFIAVFITIFITIFITVFTVFVPIFITVIITLSISVLITVSIPVLITVSIHIAASIPVHFHISVSITFNLHDTV
ncbi:hypothetical protein Pelo_5394 [Pelomyxa schiedti]|nr:hypothetical protein Pelo_5394 [Pelomyxa schiedti]